MKNGYPTLRLVEGRGFDHEIVEANTGFSELIARVYGDKAGLRLAWLFTGAPELLAAAKGVVEKFDAIATVLSFGWEGDLDVFRLRAAIAAAEGRLVSMPQRSSAGK